MCCHSYFGDIDKLLDLRLHRYRKAIRTEALKLNSSKALLICCLHRWRITESNCLHVSKQFKLITNSWSLHNYLSINAIKAMLWSVTRIWSVKNHEWHQQLCVDTLSLHEECGDEVSWSGLTSVKKMETNGFNRDVWLWSTMMWFEGSKRFRGAESKSQQLNSL